MPNPPRNGNKPPLLPTPPSPPPLMDINNNNVLFSHNVSPGGRTFRLPAPVPSASRARAGGTGSRTRMIRSSPAPQETTISTVPRPLPLMPSSSRTSNASTRSRSRSRGRGESSQQQPRVVLQARRFLQNGRGGGVSTTSNFTPSSTSMNFPTSAASDDDIFASPNHNLDRQQGQGLNSLIRRRNPESTPQRSSSSRSNSGAAVITRSRSRSRSRSRQSVSNNSKVLLGEKYLHKIFPYFTWGELLPLRCVCKKWLEVLHSNPPHPLPLGVIVIKSSSWEDQFNLFNDSPITWRHFRIEANLFIDLMDSIQLKFWMKHGPNLRTLEIKNKSMTLTGLVEVLSRCPNLEKFLVRWTPEMYQFNAEQIKKYYGVTFYNGSFQNLKELGVERSCFLNDNALMSLLRWCGGNLRSLSLTYPPEEEQDPLTRLKPRWTITPLKNYVDRFGYTANLQNLDFSWSNLTPSDLQVLADMDNLTNLKGLFLNHCKKIEDRSLTYFLLKKGAKLEVLEVEEVPLTEAIFGTSEIKQVSTPRLKSLNISGQAGKFPTLLFLRHLTCLEDLSCSSTNWLDYSKVMPALKGRGLTPHSPRALRSLQIAGGIKVDGCKHIDTSMGKVWFGNLSANLVSLSKMDLSYWTNGFGTNENFRTICEKLLLLEELRLRGWKDLGDTGVTGLSNDKLHSSEKQLIITNNNRPFVGSLKYLSVLDLSESNISDKSIKYGINQAANLRKFGFADTQISDAGIDLLLKENKTIDKICFERCQKVLNKKPHKRHVKTGRRITTGKI